MEINPVVINAINDLSSHLKIEIDDIEDFEGVKHHMKQAVVKFQRVALLIHYPDMWNTRQYPTLYSAISAVRDMSKECNNKG